jgi:hypothetical protein
LVARRAAAGEPPRDQRVAEAAAILGVQLDDLFIAAGRLPPDMRDDLRQVVQAYISGRNWLGIVLIAGSAVLVALKA